jgi:excisionase family DNA binding protein
MATETYAKRASALAVASNVANPSHMSPHRATSRLGLSTSEAARHLGVSLSTVRRWSDSGHLVGYRTPGGQRRFTVEQLDAFLASLSSTGDRRTRDVA